MESMSLEEFRNLGIGRTVRFASITVSMGDIDANGEPIKGWQSKYPASSVGTPLGSIGWVAEGRIVRYDECGFRATIRVLRVVAQSKDAKPPKVGDEISETWQGFFVP